MTQFKVKQFISVLLLLLLVLLLLLIVLLLLLIVLLLLCSLLGYSGRVVAFLRQPDIFTILSTRYEEDISLQLR